MAGGFDTRGFVLPENNFGGLYKMAGELNAQTKAKADADKEAAKQKLLGQKYIQSRFGNKDIFTGTPLDPVHNQLGGDIVNDMSGLLEAGVDIPTATMALQDKISQWTNYATNAKDFKIKNDQVNQVLSKRDDINRDEYNKTVQNSAFPIDPKTGKVDVSQYDPNKNYWDEALNNGDNVLNSNGVKKWFGSFKPTVDTNAYKYTGSTGKSTYSKNALAYPSYMQPIEDPVKGFQGFEPKHDIATDEGNTILHQQGEQVGQPVKLLKQEVWDAMPTENKMYYVQQVRNHIKQTGSKTPLDGQAAENYARALAYDDANTFGQSNTKANFNNQTNNFDKYAYAAYKDRLTLNREQTMAGYTPPELVKNVDDAIDKQEKEGIPQRDAVTGNPTGEVKLQVSPAVLKSLELKDVPVKGTDGTTTLDQNGKPLLVNYEPSGLFKTSDGKYRAVYPDGTTKYFTRDEYKGNLVNGVYNTKTKIQQLNTKPTIEVKPSSHKSSTTKVKINW